MNGTRDPSCCSNAFDRVDIQIFLMRFSHIIFICILFMGFETPQRLSFFHRSSENIYKYKYIASPSSSSFILISFTKNYISYLVLKLLSAHFYLDNEAVKKSENEMRRIDILCILYSSLVVTKT